MSDLLGKKGWTFPYFRKPVVLNNVFMSGKSISTMAKITCVFILQNKQTKNCGFLKKSSKIAASNLLIGNKNHKLRFN